MKKSLLILILSLSLIVLNACASNNRNVVEDITTTSSSSDNSVSIFKGKLSEKPIIDEESVSLYLNSVEAIQDPNNMIKTLNSDGLILNLNKDDFEQSINLNSLSEKDEIEFTLYNNAILTKSIPPQIPGVSIKSFSFNQK